MHELSLASAIVDTAVRYAEGRPVSAVHLKVGRLRQVVPDSLAFYFQFVAKDTLCDGARLEQDLIAATLRCERCDIRWELDAPPFLCPTCGGSEVGVVTGNEFLVDSIDVEEAVCTKSP